MRWYSSFRIVLIAAMLGVAVFATRSVWAQASAGGDSAPAAQPQPPAEQPKDEGGSVNPFKIVMDNVDFVFVLIMLCSVIGVALIIQGFITVRAGVLMPAEATQRMRELINQRQLRELLNYTETEPSFVARALNSALKRAPSFQAMKEAMETSVGEQTADQFRKIEYLNILGNLGPLLGLLGTVLGMITAFEKMHLTSGKTTPAVLSGGISQALCHTMLGLLLALPCLAAFGVLRTMVDRLTVRGALLAEELLMTIEKNSGVPVPATPAARPMPPGVVPQSMPVGVMGQPVPMMAGDVAGTVPPPPAYPPTRA